MPRRIKNRPRLRYTSYQSIKADDPMEPLRWTSQGPLIEGRFIPGPVGEDGREYPRIVWGSWQEWVDAYALCREEFLALRAQRPHLGKPVSERIYRAFLEDGDAGADAMVAELGKEQREYQDWLYRQLEGK